jgi:ribose/xylose/arabinose/galactoside ABC-type transport system permease subunit
MASSAKTVNKTSEIISRYGIFLVLILMILVISIIKPQFLTANNIFNVITQCSIYGILALGVTVVIIAKGIDLSLGSMLAFAGVVSASLAQVEGATNKLFPGLAQMPLIVPILVALIVGTLMG